MSPNNKYYYEQTLDEVELSVSVEASWQADLKRQVSFGRGQFNLTYSDCNMHKSCVSCLGATAQCSWCGSRCVNPGERSASPDCAERDQKEAWTRCASFDTGTSKLLVPYTAHRQQAPLVFTLSNVPTDSVAGLQCMFTLFNGRTLDGARNLTVPYQPLNGSHASCLLTSVFSVLAPLVDSYDGQIQTNLRLYDPRLDVFIDSVSNGKLALLFYKCEMKASDCSQCLTVNPQLSCMWCLQNTAMKASCRYSISK